MSSSAYSKRSRVAVPEPPVPEPPVPEPPVPIVPLVINVFNFKGGVGKTTLNHLIFHSLVDHGISTLCADLDPQCSLSWSILCPHMRKDDKTWSKFLNRLNCVESDFCVRTNLRGVTQGPQGGLIDCPTIEEPGGKIKIIRDGGNKNILKVLQAGEASGYLIPSRHDFMGSITRYDERFYMMQREAVVAEELVKIQNNLRYLASALGCRVLLVDLNPALNPFNRVQLMLSDRLVIPCAPDCFSESAVEYMKGELDSYRSAGILLDSYVTLVRRGVTGINPGSPHTQIRYLGHAFSLYRNVMNGDPAEAIQRRMEYIDNISRKIHNTFKFDADASTNEHTQNGLRIFEYEDFTAVKQYIQPLGIPVPYATTALAEIGAAYDGFRYRTTAETRFGNWRGKADDGYRKVMRYTGYENNSVRGAKLFQLQDDPPIIAEVNTQL